MSAANSAAKKRRAPPSTEPIRPPVSNMPGKPPSQPNGSSGLTLPQVIALIDTRLVRLETVTKTITDSSNSATAVEAISPEVMEEFNTRFEIIAEEVANIKNIVLNLQSYTMNVNKMLLQGRTLEGKSNDQYIGGVSSDEVELTTEEDDEEDIMVEEEVVLGEVAPQWTTA